MKQDSSTQFRGRFSFQKIRTANKTGQQYGQTKACKNGLRASWYLSLSLMNDEFWALSGVSDHWWYWLSMDVWWRIATMSGVWVVKGYQQLHWEHCDIVFGVQNMLLMMIRRQSRVNICENNGVIRRGLSKRYRRLSAVFSAQNFFYPALFCGSYG